jgi:hypothetical protein
MTKGLVWFSRKMNSVLQGRIQATRRLAADQADQADQTRQARHLVLPG